MMGMYTTLLSVLALLSPGLISASRITAVVGETLTLPCLYPATRDTKLACWGRGACPNTGCNAPVATVNGSRVIWTKSIRYQITGDITQGALPLTITDANPDDSGAYCCRVKIPGYGAELETKVFVDIQQPVLPGNVVRGSVDSTLTLPCKYSPGEGPREVCWGKGSCPISGCKNKVLATDGTSVTWSESSRYKLLGDLSKGDVSLTISGLTKDLEDTYCCRVRIPGLFNDIKNEIQLEVQDVYLVKGSLKDTLVLPCSYATDSGTHPTCWGHGHCGLVSCHNKVLQTDGDEITWRKSGKYQLNRNIAKGNVSLTIESVNAEDGGVYCCRVAVPGAFNDIKKEIRVEIRDADSVSGLVGDTIKLPCKYNVSEGTSPMCWGRGTCPPSKCIDTLVSTDGAQVSSTFSDKYELRENIVNGDVSLTIYAVKKEDEGMYCCRVEVPGLFNDKMKEVSLEVRDDGFQGSKN